MTLYITEFDDLGQGRNDKPQVAGSENTEQTPIVPTGTSQTSAPFNTNTRFIRVHTDAICKISLGTSAATRLNPTATANSMRMVAGQTEYFGVAPGNSLAVISAT